MSKRALWTVVCASVFLTACPSIPKSGAALSARVTEGVRRNQVETEKIIHALAEVERGILDEKWTELYRRVDTLYRQKHGIAANASLDFDQQLAIATTAAAARDRILADIAATEQRLLEQSRANSQKIIEMNDVVTDYLMALKNLKEANEEMTSAFQELTGIDLTALKGRAANAISKLVP